MTRRAKQTRRIPDVPYLPRDPKRRDLPIGLIGCGGITGSHLTAYRRAGYPVVALCDVDRARAEAQRDKFFRKADVYTEYADVLARDDIKVVDVTPHPDQRAPILEAAIKAGKHVLSQKPFVLDLDFGKQLVQTAARKRVQLAVNQNGRWAPHFSYTRATITEGLIGDVLSVHMSVHWDHNWVREIPAFNRVRHIILYDFAIHWFDMLNCCMRGRKAKRVFASFTRSPAQTAASNMLGQALVEYDGAQATLVFDADTQFAKQERVYVVGTKGTIECLGRDEKIPKVTLTTAKGAVSPRLKGRWFPDGFHGTMGEFLCAIEEGRESSINARDNLNSLALCFAAVQSADTSKPVVPGAVKRIRL